MALKGGTGIRKVFIENYRFSDDLDFTLREPYEKEALQEAVKDVVSRVREESGIGFEEDISIIETTTGFRATTLFRIIPMNASTPTRIIIDLTTMSNESILLPVETRQIYHPYSDRLTAGVTCYCLEEIMAEKIRSLFQRVRPRDIYDYPAPGRPRGPGRREGYSPPEMRMQRGRPGQLRAREEA